MFMLAVSFFAAGLFVWEDYKGQSQATWGLDMTIACICILNLIMRTVAQHWYREPVVVASSKWFVQMIGLETVVDLITIIPMFVAIKDFHAVGRIHYIQFNFIRVVYLVCIWDTFRGFYPFKMLSEFKFQLMATLYIIFCLLFSCAGFFNVVSREQQDKFPYVPYLHFWNCIYWSFVTLSTVGYGDISPRLSDEGQLIAIASIACALTVVPIQISRLGTIFANSDAYAGKVFCMSHIIICCQKEMGFALLADLLLELYHEDNHMQTVEVVILATGKPDEHLRNLLHSQDFYKRRITYLDGSPTVAKDLKRAGIKMAQCVVLLQSEEDSIQLLQAASILKVRVLPIYMSLSSNTLTKYLPPEAPIHVTHSLGRLHYMILGYSCLVPGFSTWLLNTFTMVKDEKRKKKWQTQYLYGAGVEANRFVVPKCFAGQKFTHVAQELFEKFEITLISYVDPDFGVIINPKYRFRGGENTYVLAQDPDQVENAEDHYRMHMINVVDESEDISNAAGKSSVAEMQLSDITNMQSVVGSGLSRMRPGDLHASAKKAEVGVFDSLGLDITNYRPENHAYEMQVYKSSAKLVNKFGEKLESLAVAEVPEITGHVIICTEVDQPHLADVLRPIRHPRLTETWPVVILSPVIPVSLEKDIFSHRFEKVHYVEGTAISTIDLERCNISRARAILILSNTEDDSFAADANAIMAYRSVQQLVEEKALNIRPTLINLTYWGNAQFFANTLEDTQTVWLETPHYAAGAVFSGEKLHTMILKPLFDSNMFEVFIALIPGARANNWRSEGKFIAVPLPESFVQAIQQGEQRHYVDLFGSLSKQHLVPVGLYRAPNTTDNPLPYVYTSPKKHCKLCITDIVFVLTQTDNSAPSDCDAEQPQDDLSGARKRASKTIPKDEQAKEGCKGKGKEPEKDGGNDIQ
eukprot:TRINITY_DN6716_c0_g1_i1.p1 TRINITY_DN6716_c0_g1~~TRINITY_DN6716_c0_g1_i1.p1  ORF type:complete len:920 (+),score=201.09 TRINITY_DN6716_c0_g1_i1:160-2919(+)